jgi:hypothetical protein
MAKVIKLKQSDIEKIVSGILKEQEWKGSTNPEIMQLGQMGPEEVSEEDDESSVELSLGQDEQGNFYVMKNTDGSNPEVLAKTK